MFNSKNASLSTYKSSIFDKISINVFSIIHKLNLSPLVLLICQYLCKLVSASKHTVVLIKNLHYVIYRTRQALSTQVWNVQPFLSPYQALK